MTDHKPPVKIYINKIENRIKFRIESGCHLELLMPETINYLESLKRMNKDKNCENVPPLRDY